MNVLKPGKQLAVISALVEGNSIRSVERMTGIHRDTIMRLMGRVGERCAGIMDERMRNVQCQEIEADEIWCFVGKKQRRLTDTDKAAGELGDAYTFIALDPETKLIPVFRVGKRDARNTQAFISDLRRCVVGRIQLSTDAFRPYVDAVERAFGADVDYAQIVKNYAPENAGRGRYSPPVVVGVEKVEIAGRPNWFKVCTSYVERHNLTIRMQLRRFTRLTNGFSKKLANLKAMVALYICYYNFCRIHSSLRVTPAMAAGVTDRVWNLNELIG
jgi:IS1 family transposase